MEWLSERFARRSLLRCLALSAMGAAALLAPGFLERGLACCAMFYLLANGVALVVRACAGGPHDPASRAGLMMACLLLGLAGALASLLQPWVGARGDRLRRLSLGQFAGALVAAMGLCAVGLLLFPGKGAQAGLYLGLLVLLHLLAPLL